MPNGHPLFDRLLTESLVVLKGLKSTRAAHVAAYLDTKTLPAALRAVLTTQEAVDDFIYLCKKARLGVANTGEYSLYDLVRLVTNPALDDMKIAGEAVSRADLLKWLRALDERNVTGIGTLLKRLKIKKFEQVRGFVYETHHNYHELGVKHSSRTIGDDGTIDADAVMDDGVLRQLKYLEKSQINWSSMRDWLKMAMKETDNNLGKIKIVLQRDPTSAEKAGLKKIIEDHGWDDALGGVDLDDYVESMFIKYP